MKETEDENSNKDNFEHCSLGMPSKDLELYTEIIFELERGNAIEEPLTRLSKYGNSLKEIDLWFQQHLGDCYSCKEEHTKDISTYRYLSSTEFWKDQGLSATRLTSRENLEKLLKKFGIEHFEMEDEAIKLRNYILNKYRTKKASKSNPRYEQHIRECDLCRAIDSSAKKTYDDLDFKKEFGIE